MTNADITRTGMKKPLWHETQRPLSEDSPPPVTIQTDVGMIHEVLPPGVQNANAPDPCTEMFRVVCEFCESDKTLWIRCS